MTPNDAWWGRARIFCHVRIILRMMTPVEPTVTKRPTSPSTNAPAVWRVRWPRNFTKYKHAGSSSEMLPSPSEPHSPKRLTRSLDPASSSTTTPQLSTAKIPRRRRMHHPLTPPPPMIRSTTAAHCSVPGTFFVMAHSTSVSTCAAPVVSLPSSRVKERDAAATAPNPRPETESPGTTT